MVTNLKNEIPTWYIETIDESQLPVYENFEGKPLLILFFYLGCPGCVGRAIPYANGIVHEYKNQINVLGIHSNFEGPEYSDQEIKDRLKELYVKFPVYRDAGLATTFHQYKAAGTPHWILVNKNGDIVRSLFGSDPNRALLWLDYSIKEELI